MPSHAVPHFLRFTQALALVSGLGLPCAMLVTACGGDESPSTSDGGNAEGSVADGYSGSAACDACGISSYDGGVLGTAPYDGGGGIEPAPDAGVADGFSGIMVSPDASADAEIEGGGGGPLAPPDLPA
jgi:hypothetical protein